jgi:hypothetical protein
MSEWMRRNRWWLLLAAWIIFILSLFGPAYDVELLRILGAGMPVWALPVAARAEMSGNESPGIDAFALFAMVCFLLSTIIMVVGTEVRPIAFAKWPVMVIGLLLTWAIPIAHLLPEHEHWHLLFLDCKLLWGFYLFACALTVGFVACVLGPPKSPRPGRARGFAVLPPVRPPPPAR